MKKKRTESKKRVIYCGGQGFPFGSATVQRQIQMSKALQDANFEVFVLINRGTYTRDIIRREGIRVFGTHENIKYFHTSFCAYKPKNYFIRNFLKVFGTLSEFFFIGSLTVFKKGSVLLFRAHDLNSAKFYARWGRLFNLKIIYDYVEYYDSLRKRDQKSIEVLKKNSFDRNIFMYCDKFIVISEFLKEHVKRYKKEFLKIPPIIDFDQFVGIEKKDSDRPYFLYCGSIVYLDVIRFIIDSFTTSGLNRNGFYLKLVLSGSLEEIENLVEKIEFEDLSESIEVLNKLKYEQLISYYAGASALLIPLSESLQDKARFPFKICEYLASRRPIITSGVGVINEYFTADRDAFICPTNDQRALAEKFKLVAVNKDLADEIGLKGYYLGRKHFHYENYVQDLRSFFLDKA